MSVNITVGGNNVDMSSMIHNGTYSPTNTIGQLSGIPSGLKTFVGCVNPSPFGIVENSVDICNQYVAIYSDSVVTIPNWASKLFVVCVGGGQGKRGKQGDVQYIGNKNQNNVTVYGAEGSNGGDGLMNSLTVNVGSSKSYSVTIGAGTGKTDDVEWIRSRDYYLRRDNKEAAVPNVGGNTVFTYGSQICTANGGSIGTERTVIEGGQPFVGYGIGGTLSTPTGGNGYCRVYFLK